MFTWQSKINDLKMASSITIDQHIQVPLMYTRAIFSQHKIHQISLMNIKWAVLAYNHNENNSKLATTWVWAQWSKQNRHILTSGICTHKLQTIYSSATSLSNHPFAVDSNSASPFSLPPQYHLTFSIWTSLASLLPSDLSSLPDLVFYPGRIAESKSWVCFCLWIHDEKVPFCYNNSGLQWELSCHAWMKKDQIVLIDTQLCGIQISDMRFGIWS